MAAHRLAKEVRRSDAFHFCTHRRYFSIISAHQTQDESVQSNDVVLPNHVVEYFNAFVELLPSSRCRKLIDEEVGEGPHVGHQCAGADAFQDPGVWEKKEATPGISHYHFGLPPAQ